jgi:hypothetical protein
MNFTEVLKKHGLTEEAVSHALKVKIKRYNKFLAAIGVEKEKLTKATTDRAKQVIENEITKGEEYLVSLNQDICDHIDKFAQNIELNQRKAENLKKTREAKGKGKTETPASEEKPAASSAPASEEKPASSTPESEEVIEETPAASEEVAAVEDDSKKKKTPWGLILSIGLALATGGAIAYHHFKNKE